MQTIVLILLLLLAGCAEFQTKMDQMNCQPPHNTLCAGWKV
jgi:outer membrane murein-binding lipoprotein Lpp